MAAVRPRRLALHLPPRPLGLRRPVLADRQVRADPLAGDAAGVPDSAPAACCKMIAELEPDVDHLDLPRRHRGARDAAREAPPRDPGAVGDHRPRRAALLGPPGRRPPLRHPPRVDRGSRAPGRAGTGGMGAAADLRRVPRPAHPPRRPRGARRRRPRAHGPGLRRRLGRRRPGAGDRAGARRRRDRGGLHRRPQRARPEAARSALRATTSGSASSASPTR